MNHKIFRPQKFGAILTTTFSGWFAVTSSYNSTITPLYVVYKVRL